MKTDGMIVIVIVMGGRMWVSDRDGVFFLQQYIKLDGYWRSDPIMVLVTGLFSSYGSQ